MHTDKILDIAGATRSQTRIKPVKITAAIGFNEETENPIIYAAAVEVDGVRSRSAVVVVDRPNGRVMLPYVAAMGKKEDVYVFTSSDPNDYQLG